MSTSTPTFAEKFEEITFESTYSVFGFARTLEDPWAYMSSVLEDIAHLSDEYEDEYNEFVDRAKNWMDILDSAFTSDERDAVHDREDEFEPEYSPVGQSFDRGYNPRQRIRDIWDMDSPVFVREQYNKKSRDIWQRTTKNDSTSLRILCDYGNFDMGLTEKYGKALLRIRTVTRNVKGVPTPFLSIGAVQVNMRTGFVKCGVFNCEHEGHLSHKYLSDGTWDKEWAEYQILRIFAHLGTHGKDSNRVFPKFVDEPKLKRDDAITKIVSHWQWLYKQEHRTSTTVTV